MFVILEFVGFFLQNCLGGWLRGCGGATWWAAVGCADASMTQALTPAADASDEPRPWTRSTGPRWTAEGVRPFF
jgi:hypothetical protein